MDLGYDVIVTITGIALVFLILVLLMAIITLEGKVFGALNAKKAAAKAAASTPKAPPAAKPAAASAPAPAPAPEVEQGIPGEVVAAIAAAIHALGGGKYTLRAVRRGANNWGKAGVNDTTAPF
ncbi:MAG: OadG family protein [Faecalibacterium sp.]